MNRFETIRRTLLWESVAAAARARAAVLREELAAEARKEFAEQGTAPTWRLPELATVTLPVSKETVYVADEQALIAHLKAEPGAAADVIEVTECVRPSYLHDLLNVVVQVVDGCACYEDGTVVPGLSVRPGGVPAPLSFRPSSEAKAVLAKAAEQTVDEIAASFGVSDVA